jgi:hypothetical protein
MKKSLLVLLASAITFTNGRIGVGPCPTSYPKVIDGYNNLNDGRYFAYSGDALGLFVYKTFFTTFKPSERLECWAANVTKSSTGFTWSPYFELDSLSYCRKNVKCDAGQATCNCYVTAKPWEVVYHDTSSDTLVAYQCTDMKYALKVAKKNLGNPPILSEIIEWLGDKINNFHVSGLGVATKNPNSLSSADLANLNAFINNFPDQEPGYVPFAADQAAASVFGYNYKPTYSTTDLTKIDQSESRCRWSTTP